MNMQALPEIVGILNLSPESFSGDGLSDEASSELVVERVTSLIAEGASIIDIGAQSTRPGAGGLQPDLELLRLRKFLPQVVSISHHHKVKVSLDSCTIKCVEFGLEQGVDWINDVKGGQSPELVSLVAKSSASYVAMHSLSVPADRAITIQGDAVEALLLWTEELVVMTESLGLSKDRLIIDPGIGFGKTSSQSWDIIKACEVFRKNGHSILFGHSRKSFFNEVTDVAFSERDLETHIVSCYLAERGAKYLRVHDVAGCRRALAVASYLSSSDSETNVSS
jgi:2-amino-4-hydroxy-6-hydroxymethyldihydropteridine diphosphokinase / dihydropteroate synthase